MEPDGAGRGVFAPRRGRLSCGPGPIRWRGRDLNPRPSGYEPDELTRLLHPASGLWGTGTLHSGGGVCQSRIAGSAEAGSRVR